ncbi:hypothetical protein V1280_005081 [Bradyrhizobium sp. AZCC 2230]|jgi:hypothetical protein
MVARLHRHRGSAVFPLEASLTREAEALHALSFVRELVLGRPVMDEHYVRIAAAPNIERLAGANGDDLHGDATPFLSG